MFWVSLKPLESEARAVRARRLNLAAWIAFLLRIVSRFPYADTLKVFEKWGPGCTFLGHGLASDITALTTLLSSLRTDSDLNPILALVCEFPSNPLLRSADLVKIRELADEYGFVVIVDETVGNFVNVEVMEWADIVVSSLTKVFSGETNVMGGRLVPSPKP